MTGGADPNKPPKRWAHEEDAAWDDFHDLFRDNELANVVGRDFDRIKSGRVAQTRGFEAWCDRIATTATKIRTTRGAKRQYDALLTLASMAVRALLERKWAAWLVEEEEDKEYELVEAEEAAERQRRFAALSPEAQAAVMQQAGLLFEGLLSRDVQ